MAGGTDLPPSDPAGTSPSPEGDGDRRANRQRGAAQQTASKFMLFIGASWLRAASAILVGFVMAPLLLGEFGIVLFGLYMLIARGTAALVNPIRVSLNQLYIKAMTVATAGQDEERTSEVMTNVVVMTFTVGFLFIGLGVLLSALAPAVIAFPDHYEIHVRTILITEAVVVALLVMRNPWLGLFLVEHRPLSYNFDMIVQRWIDPVAFALAFIPLGFDVFSSFMVIRVVLTAGNSAFRMVMASRLVPAARFRIRQIRWRTIRGLGRTGALTTAQPFSEFAFDVVDSYLLNITFGPVFNGLYSVVNSLRFYARKLGQDASVGTEAIAADMHERGKHETVVRSLLASMRLVSGIMLICSGIIAIFFGPIVDVWLGKAMSQDEELLKIMSYETAIDLAWMFVLLLLVGGILMEVSIAGSRFLYGMGLIGKYSGVLFAAGLSKILLAASVVVLFLSPAELPYLDKTSLEATLLFPASTLLCQLFFFGFFFPRRLIRLAGIPVGRYLVQVWLRPMAAVMPSLAIGAVFILLIESWTIWHLLLTLIGVGLSFIPMIAFVLLTPPERKQIIAVLRRLLNRMRGRGPRETAAPGDLPPS